MGRQAFACFMIICAKHQQRDCYEALLELETRYCRQEPIAYYPGALYSCHRAQTTEQDKV